MPDIAAKEWMVEVARQIMGMANRDPDAAHLVFEGCGYLLLGVEAGTVHGVRSLDLADVENKLAPYLGTDGPRWTWVNLAVGNQTVVVVTVEPPRWGDPIFCFQSGYTGIDPGTIFVRRPGKTERANAADIARLTDRARRAAARLDVVLTFQEPVASMPCVTDTPADLDAWVAGRVCDMNEAAQSIAARSEITPAGAGDLSRAFAAMHLSMLAAFTVKETRSLDEYLRQVDAWARKARGALSAYVRDLAPRVARTPPLCSVLVNSTDRNFKSVRVEVRVEGNVTAHLPPRSGRKQATLPPPPVPFGPRPATAFAGLGHIPGLMGGFHSMPEDVWVDNLNSARVTFATVDLRPHHHVELGRFWLVGGAGLAGGEATLAWHASATNVDGLSEGQTRISFSAPAMSLRDVLEATGPQEAGPDVDSD